MNTEKSASQDTATPGSETSDRAGASKYEKYAATQAAGDGIEGDVKQQDKTDEEKLGAQMTDRK